MGARCCKTFFVGNLQKDLHNIRRGFVTLVKKMVLMDRVPLPGIQTNFSGNWSGVLKGTVKITNMGEKIIVKPMPILRRSDNQHNSSLGCKY